VQRYPRGHWFNHYFAFSFGFHFVFLRSNEFMFLLPNDENGARRGAHDPLRGAANAKMFPPGVAMSGDHDEIDIVVPRDLNDFVCR
jgi:hypothetical protein